MENYGTCCAHGGYKVEGHKDVCRLAKAKLVKSARPSLPAPVFPLRLGSSLWAAVCPWLTQHTC